MRTAQIKSISIPPRLAEAITKAQDKSGMTRSELLRAALRRYLEQEGRWRELQDYGVKQSKEMGLKTEEDVMTAALAFRQGRPRKK